MLGLGVAALAAALGALLWLAAPAGRNAAPGGVTLAPAAQASAGAVGVGSDPLTPWEESLALEGLQALRGVEAASGVRSLQTADGRTLQTPAEQVLLVERKQEEKGAVAAAAAGGAALRRADLYLYRYADDRLIHAVHDLATGETVVVEEAQGVQLPLTEAERALATEIAFADPALLALMQEEHLQIVGEPLTGAEQVDVRAFVYHSGAAPEIEPPEAAACGRQRCAQLLVLTGNNITFSILPIVNLSTLRTASAIPLAVNDGGQAEEAGSGEHDHNEGVHP
jgi:hypothetical protein